MTVAALLWMGAAEATDLAARAPASPPLRIDDAETVEAGQTEINLTVGGTFGRGAWEADALRVDANLGLCPRVHINAEVPLTFAGPPPTGGLGQAAVAVKWRPLQWDRGQIAIHPAVELPPSPGDAAAPTARAALTLPVVVDLSVGPAGVGLELARTFTADRADAGWEALAGLGTSIADRTALLVDYAQEADATGALGEGWLEVGAVRDRLLGQEHLALLASLGRSTAAQTTAMLGVQIGTKGPWPRGPTEDR